MKAIIPIVLLFLLSANASALTVSCASDKWLPIESSSNQNGDIEQMHSSCAAQYPSYECSVSPQFTGSTSQHNVVFQTSCRDDPQPCPANMPRDIYGNCPSLGECEDVPNVEKCLCEQDGKFWDGLSSTCEVIPECPTDTAYDSVFNDCFTPQGCKSGHSLDSEGNCVPNPEPEPPPPEPPEPPPEPNPSPEPEPSPNPAPDPNGDPDGDGSPNSSDDDDDGDGTPDRSDSDIDGDGVPNSEDPDYQINVDMSGVESRLNKANTYLNNIDQRVKQSNSYLNQIDDTGKKQLASSKALESGLGALNKTARDIEDGVGLTNSYLDDILGELQGDGPDTGTATGSTPTFEQTSQAIEASIFGQPFIASIMTIPTLGGAGSCPTYSMDLGRYGTHVMNNHCTLLNEHRSKLSLLFTMLWSLAAAMIFLRA